MTPVLASSCLLLWLPILGHLLSVVGLYTYREEEPLSCLEARMKCLADQGCRSLLDVVPEFCDKEVSMCTSSKRDQCYSALTSLQMNPYFYSCACEPIDVDATQCIEFQRSIFNHACLRKGVHNNTSPGLYRAPLDLSRLPTHEYDLYDGREDDHEDHNDVMVDHKHDISCIGVRKNCLLNSKCNRELANFRELCRENKKNGRCVSDDREGCWKTINELKGTGIFSCMCHMQREYTREKCDRIQWRLANNTCLYEVPYFIHSRQRFESTYNDLVSFVDSTQQDQNGPVMIQETAFEGNCVQAFAACNADPSCKLRMTAFMNACLWNRESYSCNRHECLTAIQHFYLYVRPERSHALLFCTCPHADDEKCQAIRAGMYPTCSVLEMPPPSCLDIINRCTQDPDCRVRLNGYQVHCGYERRSGGCPSSPDMCRSAMLGVMGTILTTNCTCRLADEYDNTKCLEARKRLHNDNICKEMAVKDFQQQYTTTPKMDMWMSGVGSTDKAECQRHLGYTIPKYMDVPPVIRKYNNESDCSSLCQCLRNDSLRCEKLPCKLDLSCRVNHIVYIHGSSFVQTDNRQCRCIKGEIVCAKLSSVRKKPGLFMHVGYSVGDLYLVEGHSNIRFDAVNVAAKLGALVNGDSAQQFCKVNLFSKEEGNLIFEISVSVNNQNDAALEGCIRSAQRLSYMINSRDMTILTDAELSVLKVSQLESVHFHNPSKDSADRDIHTSPRSRGSASTVYTHSLALYNILGIALLSDLLLVLLWT